MIVLDLQQTMISNLMMQLGKHTNVELEEGLLRHMVLNSIRSYKQQFGNQYGELVIACDDKNYWRRQLFPYYKANRKKAREQSDIDWKTIFEFLNKMKEELKDFFPYRVIQVDTAEADDIIATLVQKLAVPAFESILILSGDKDFIQLHKYSNVVQYDPVRKRWVQHNDPDKYLQEHVMKGDQGDGIPNFLSSDNCLVIGQRQKPLRQSKIDQWLDKQPELFCTEEMLRNYKRNQQLIDLKYIPVDIQAKIIEQYNNQSDKKRDKLFNYFIKNKLKNLMESVGEF